MSNDLEWISKIFNDTNHSLYSLSATAELLEGGALELTTVQNSLQQLKDEADFKLFRQITAVTTVTSACTV